MDEEKRLQLEDLAKAAERERDYPVAANCYCQLLERWPRPYYGSRYLDNLSRVSAAEARLAVAQGEKLRHCWPHDKWIKLYYYWAIYRAFLKYWPDSQEPYEEFIIWANLLLAETDDWLIRKQTIFRVCTRAKVEENWADVQRFASKLQAEQLSAKVEHWQNFSDRQRWHYWTTGSLHKLGEYAACAAACEQALADYPDDQHFCRYYALSQIQLGKVEEGIEALKLLNIRFPRHWYMAQDIGRALLQQGKQEEGLGWLAEAALVPGKWRSALLIDIARLLLERKEYQAAKELCLLACRLAEESGYKNQMALAEGILHQACQASCLPVPDWRQREREELFSRCRLVLRPFNALVRPEVKGKVTRKNEKGHAFVRADDGRELYLRRHEFWGQEIRKGQKVLCLAVEAYDPVKKSNGWRAICAMPYKG